MLVLVVIYWTAVGCGLVSEGGEVVPIGGRKSLISPLVISSGYEPPVCSKRERLRDPSSVDC